MTKNVLNDDELRILLKKISSSGVVFTRSVETGSPYYTINIDEETGENVEIKRDIKDLASIKTKMCYQ